MTRTTILCLAIALSGCTRQQPETTDAHHYAPLIRILASPDNYDGKRVVTEGYLHLGFESSSLFLSKSDFDNLLTQNSIAIVVPDDIRTNADMYSDQYVKVAGRFTKLNDTFISLFTDKLDVEIISLKSEEIEAMKE